MVDLIKIWGSKTPRTLRPIWIAEELEIKYEHLPISPRSGETLTKEYTNLNPKQKIPFLEHGEFRISESLAICRYLKNIFPSNNFYSPQTPEELAKEDEWCSFIYGELDETCLYVMRRHYDLTDIYGSSPNVVETCREYLKRQFVVIDSYIENKKSLLTQGFGVADIFLVSCLDWAVFYEFELPKNIKIYRDEISNRKAYKKAMEINYQE
jgi:glutathione S-transferase